VSVETELVVVDGHPVRLAQAEERRARRSLDAAKLLNRRLYGEIAELKAKLGQTEEDDDQGRESGGASGPFVFDHEGYTAKRVRRALEGPASELQWEACGS
jgi:hypothetical protein